jgi:hypothetical protein
VSFFETRAEREIYTANSAMSRSLNSSDNALSRAYAQALIVGQLASERDAGSLRYINTENTVRDMLRIVQAHGREKLQFWGFSCVQISKPPQPVLIYLLDMERFWGQHLQPCFR